MITRLELDRLAVSLAFALMSAFAAASEWPRTWVLTVAVVASTAAAALSIALSAIRGRLHAWAHWASGLCLAPVPIATWVATWRRLDLAPLLLAGALAFWVAGFDIICSCEGIQADRQRGAFTLPARWGARKSLLVAALNHLVAAWLLALFGWTGPVGWLFLVGVIVISFGLFLFHRTLRPERLAGAASNAAVMSLVLSLVLLGFAAADVLVIGKRVLI